MKTGKIRFETESGSGYELDSIVPDDFGFTAGMRRYGKPFVNIAPGVDMNDGEHALVKFYSLPKIGESFFYNHASWGGCISTPVREILEEEWSD